ncbi:MAG: hypothetical protein ACTSU5_03910 [Promethearchaeota archaeon]
MAKKESEGKKVEFNLKKKMKRVQTLYDTNRIKEAVAYLFLVYARAVEEHLGVERKRSHTVRELGIKLVKKKNQSPETLYPFVQKVEEIVYSGFPVRKEDLLQAFDLFSKLYSTLTNRPVNVALKL